MTTDLAIADAEIQRLTSPGDLADLFQEAASAIEEGKDRAAALASRGVLARIFSNNTRDLAESLLSQSKAQELFFRLLQRVTFLNMTNTVLLADLEAQLEHRESLHGGSQKQYLRRARDYVATALAAATAFEKRVADLSAAQKSTERAVDAVMTEMRNSWNELQVRIAAVDASAAQAMAATKEDARSAYNALGARLSDASSKVLGIGEQVQRQNALANEAIARVRSLEHAIYHAASNAQELAALKSRVGVVTWVAWLAIGMSALLLVLLSIRVSG